MVNDYGDICLSNVVKSSDITLRWRIVKTPKGPLWHANGWTKAAEKGVQFSE